MCGVITGVEECALCVSSMHDVHHASVGVNVVIGVLVVHCELLVVRVCVPLLVVCDEAVVLRTLVLIALHRRICFRRSHFSKNFAVLEVYCLQQQALMCRSVEVFGSHVGFVLGALHLSETNDFVTNGVLDP